MGRKPIAKKQPVAKKTAYSGTPQHPGRKEESSRLLMAKRPRIPIRVKSTVLANNLHNCCICRIENLDVQLHHIDGDPRNNAPGNLAVLCLHHHSKVTGNAGLGQKYSRQEVAIYKRTWEAECARLSKIRSQTLSKEVAAAKKSRRSFTYEDFNWIHVNKELLMDTASLVGLQLDGGFGLTLREELLLSLESAGLLSKRRPETLQAFKANQLVLDTFHATKVLFPHEVLQMTVPGVRELAVWIAEPDPKVLSQRTNDHFDFSGTFVYIVASIFENGISDSFLSGCSALQVISNMKTGKPLFNRNPTEELGRGSYLRPTEKLLNMGGIVIERRKIDTLYRCRYMTDEQCFNDGVRAYRCHDLLTYPIFVAQSLKP